MGTDGPVRVLFLCPVAIELNSQAWLDPRHCPYIAHLVHSNGFRPWRLGARIEFFDGPPRRVDWWLLDQPR